MVLPQPGAVLEPNSGEILPVTAVPVTFLSAHCSSGASSVLPVPITTCEFSVAKLLLKKF